MQNTCFLLFLFISLPLKSISYILTLINYPQKKKIHIMIWREKPKWKWEHLVSELYLQKEWTRNIWKQLIFCYRNHCSTTLASSGNCFSIRVVFSAPLANFGINSKTWYIPTHLRRVSRKLEILSLKHFGMYFDREYPLHLVKSVQKK